MGEVFIPGIKSGGRLVKLLIDRLHFDRFAGLFANLWTPVRDVGLKVCFNYLDYFDVSRDKRKKITKNSFSENSSFTDVGWSQDFIK